MKVSIINLLVYCIVVLVIHQDNHFFVGGQWINVLNYYNYSVSDPGGPHPYYKVVSYKSGICYIDEVNSQSIMYKLNPTNTYANMYYSNNLATPCVSTVSTNYNDGYIDVNLLYKLTPYPLVPRSGSLYYERYQSNCSQPQNTMRISTTPGMCLLDEGTGLLNYNKGEVIPTSSVTFSTASDCFTLPLNYPVTGSCSTNTRHLSNGVSYSMLVWSVPALIATYTTIQIPPFTTNLGYYDYNASIDGTSTWSMCPSSTGCTLTVPPLSTNPVPITLTLLGTLYDSQSLSKSIFTSLLVKPEMNPLLVSSTTKSATISYSHTGGGTSNTYTILVDGSVIATTQQSSYTINTLQQGVSYVIGVYVTSDGMNSNPQTITIQIYNSVSTPTLSITQQSPTNLLLNASSTGGIPGQSQYTFKQQSTVICGPSITNTCSATVGTAGIYTFTVEVSNDGLTKSFSKNFTNSAPVAPSLSLGTITHNSIAVSWTVSGSRASDYTYIVQLSTDSVNWINLETELTSLNTIVNNLTPSTTYYIQVGAFLPGNPVPYSNVVTTTTLQDPRTICTKGCVHGTCINAACVCEEGYTGITCESDAPISNTNITVNPTLPTIVLSLGGKTSSFLMSDLIERDLKRNQVASLSLSKVNWTLTSQLNTTVTHPVTNEQLYSSSWTYKMINISNQFSITIKFTQFTKISNTTLATYFPIQFAGIGINVTLGSLKYTMTITKWPFKSILNTLELSNTIVPPLDDCGEYTVESVETRDNVQMMIGQGSGGTNVYTSLSSRALVDNVPRRILHQFVSDNDNTGRIVTESPYFTNALVIDPELSLLISGTDSNGNNSSCKEKKKLTKEQIIGIAVGGAAFVLIVSLATVYILKRKYNFYREGIKIKMVKISQTTAE